MNRLSRLTLASLATFGAGFGFSARGGFAGLAGFAGFSFAGLALGAGFAFTGLPFDFTVSSSGAERFSSGGRWKPPIWLSSASAIASTSRSPPSGPMICTPHGNSPFARGTGITTEGRWHTVASAIHAWNMW